MPGDLAPGAGRVGPPSRLARATSSAAHTRVARAQLRVDDEVVVDDQEPGVRQERLGLVHTDGGEHEVGLQGRAVVEAHRAGCLDAVDLCAGTQLHAGPDQPSGQPSGHAIADPLTEPSRPGRVLGGDQRGGDPSVGPGRRQPRTR